MGATVNVDKRTVVHKDSGGKAISVPDFCKTPAPPGPPIPVPYVNLAKSSDTADGSTTVTVDGNPIMLKDSNFSTSSGDEAGTLKGVASNTNKGIAKFANYSFTVKVEGKNVARLGDPMTDNGNAPNSTNMAELQASLLVTDAIITAKELLFLCKIVCSEAAKRGDKDNPVRRSNNANEVLKNQTRFSRIKPERAFKGCRPDFLLVDSAGELLAKGDFKWLVSNDRFRGSQLKKMRRIQSKHREVIKLDEKDCRC